MSKPDFLKCTKLATDLLYNQNLSNRFLDVASFSFDKPIIFDSIQNYCLLAKSHVRFFINPQNMILSDGCCLFLGQNDGHLVLYNDKMQSDEHRNWTLAHEIGHIYMGHSRDGRKEEIEAHFFASQIFMPEYSLYMIHKLYGKLERSDVAEIFGVSLLAATKRLVTMNRKTSVNAGIKDISIWERQKEKVALYFNCKNRNINFRYALEKNDYNAIFNPQIISEC